MTDFGGFARLIWCFKSHMSDDPLPSKGVLRGLAKDKKRNILLAIILVIAAGLFFLSFSQRYARAAQKEKMAVVSLEKLDPLQRIGRHSFSDEDKALKEYVAEKTGKDARDPEEKAREEEYRRLTVGYPIEQMASAMSEEDSETAAFLLGIAKKESDWGKHTPKKNGQECYNYWGYRGKENPTESGYSCFDSPEQAVSIVGGRIKKLIDEGLDTPERMIVWKCGSSCSGHDPAGVQKWISDVKTYYNKCVS